MNSTAAFLAIMTLGLIKAAFFVGVTVWCLRNDQAIDEDQGGGGGGLAPSPDSPYKPGGTGRNWKVRLRRKTPVQ